MKKIKWLGIVLLITVMGCASSKITTSWKAKNITPQQYTKILVLGLIRDTDRRIQERMEQHFVGDLTDLGYSAISALQEYGPKAFDSLNEKTALDKIKNTGADAVITIVLLDIKKERKYVQAQISYVRDFWGYYGSRYSRIYEPGYYVTDTKYFWESNFYDMRNQALLYSVQTESFSPENTESMGHEYGKLIVNNMVKKKYCNQNLQRKSKIN
ncbi:MAG: hypothetical protein IPJ81_04820 [Chitinophagaceae bacterium]|nr:hypothetical protein [Chitinophagaceae bacterium]